MQSHNTFLWIISPKSRHFAVLAVEIVKQYKNYSGSSFHLLQCSFQISLEIAHILQANV